jgi:hypothetical protein
MATQFRTKLWKAFYSQRASASDRGIDFLLTFSEWLDIWAASGHLSERGKRIGCYCMARYGDTGPYSVDNVKIIMFGDNVSEGQSKPKSLQWRLNIGLANKGKHFGKQPTRSVAWRKKLSIALQGHVLSEETKRKISRTKRGIK